jgi:hypothetical protein
MNEPGGFNKYVSVKNVLSLNIPASFFILFSERGMLKNLQNFFTKVDTDLM